MTLLTDLKVPGPTVTALTEPFWQAVNEDKFIIQRCGACNKAVFYPRGICPHCWTDALSWEPASGKGRLKSFTKVFSPGHPGWVPAAPYIIGLVELVEGPTMLSHILTGGEVVAIGDPLRFAPTDVGGRGILPCFEIDLSTRRE